MIVGWLSSLQGPPTVTFGGSSCTKPPCATHSFQAGFPSWGRKDTVKPALPVSKHRTRCKPIALAAHLEDVLQCCPQGVPILITKMRAI
jgi:hypothetical protein